MLGDFFIREREGDFNLLWCKVNLGYKKGINK